MFLENADVLYLKLGWLELSAVGKLTIATLAVLIGLWFA
jgi:hypothetical protein